MIEDDLPDDWETDWFRAEHSFSPAPFARCPDCGRFSRYPWQRTYATENGTDHVIAGICRDHGAWREGSL